MMAVRSRLTSAFGAAGYSALVAALGQIATVPVLVVHWGATGYGEWIALTALATYLTYANVGIPGALRAEMAIAFGQGNRPRMIESFQTSLLLMLGVALVVGGGFISAAQILPFDDILKGGPIREHEARLVASALGLQIVIILVASVLQAALGAVGRYGLAMFLEATRQAIEFVLLLLLVGLFSVRAGWVCLIFPVIAGAYVALLFVILWGLAPWLFALPFRAEGRVLRKLSRPMIGVIAASLGYYGLSIQGPRLILAAVLGPAAVTTYSVTIMMMRLARLPISILAHAPTVELSFAHGEQDQARAQNIFTRGLRISLWLSLALIPMVLLFGRPAVHIWTRGRVDLPVSLLLLASISTVLFSVALPCQEALMSLGKLGKAAVWLLIGSAPFVGLTVLMTRTFGLNGMGGSIVILDGAYAALALGWVLPLFGFAPGAFIRQLLTPPVDVLADEGARLLEIIQNSVFRRRAP